LDEGREISVGIKWLAHPIHPVHALLIPYQVRDEPILLLGIEERKNFFLSQFYIYVRKDYGMDAGVPQPLVGIACSKW
jgi:hypothetical protein